jgi:hypothetical protein
MAGIWSFVPAAAAVGGSVALSLLILHPSPPALLPGTAPGRAVEHGHPSAVVLPARHVERAHPNTGLRVPRPAHTAVASTTPSRAVSPPATHPVPTQQPPSPPPTETVPTPETPPVTTPVTSPVTTPETQPVTTPVTPPPTTTPAKAHSNNGRWKSSKAMSWKGAAAKQGGREHKGKPPWAGRKGQKGQQPATTPTSSVPAPTHTSKTPPGHSKAPPGKSKTPPGHSKTPPGQAETSPEQAAPATGAAKDPPGEDKTPPGQAKKGK